MGIPAIRTSNIIWLIVDQLYVDPVMVLLTPENLGQVTQTTVKRSLNPLDRMFQMNDIIFIFVHCDLCLIYYCKVV